MHRNNLREDFFKKNKVFLIIEVVLIVGILGVLFIINKPDQIYPLNGMTISNDNFIFEVENGDQVLISNTPDFSNTIVLYKNSEITLPPGRYFWKVRNKFRESDTRSFFIEERVGLEINNKKSILRNSGNVDLNVSKDNNIRFVLKKGQLKIIKPGNATYLGEKNE